MNFTKEEAEAKKGKRVRVRDNCWLSSDGIAKGIIGTVVNPRSIPVKSKSLIEGDEPAGREMTNEGEGIWVVDVEFDDRSILPIKGIRKNEYKAHLDEI